MSEHRSQATTTVARPAPEGYQSWPDYWKAQGMPWRTEPEIDEKRQRYLVERRAIQADIEKGIYPFRDENGSGRRSSMNSAVRWSGSSWRSDVPPE